MKGRAPGWHPPHYTRALPSQIFSLPSSALAQSQFEDDLSTQVLGSLEGTGCRGPEHSDIWLDAVWVQLPVHRDCLENTVSGCQAGGALQGRG